MAESFWWSVGQGLGVTYAMYAWFLFLGCLGPHLLVLASCLWRGSQPKPPQRLSVRELVYGLLNPVVYLLVFQPALLRVLSPGWLTALCWVALVGYWCLRLLIPASLPAGAAAKRIVRAWLALCLLLVVGVGLRDLVPLVLLNWHEFNQPFGLLLVLLGSPLYLVPAVILLRQLRFLVGAEPEAVDGFFVCAIPVRAVAVTTVAAMLGSIAIAAWRPSVGDTRALLLRHRADILNVSAHARLDPRLLASIVFVTHREHTTPFRSALEQVVAAAWLVDPKSHMLISRALNPSLGLAQVKPVTVLTALAIYYASAGGSWLPSKEYREVPEQGDAWQRIPSTALATLEPPARPEQSGKRSVVRALLDPAQNLALSAFVLELTAAHWEAANPAWSIRTRPDILATLYQIGFQHSHPKADPQANAFGERVLQVFHEPWMQEHFAAVHLPE